MTAALAVTAAASLAPAAPLDQITCEQLKGDVVELDRIGARTNMAKGAAWGKANLNAAQLEQVRKLIEIEEALAFRCPVPKPKPVAAASTTGKATPANVKAKVLPKAPARVKAAEVDPTGKDAKAKPKAKPATRPASASAVTADPSAPPPPKPRPRAPNPKPNDALVPATK